LVHHPGACRGGPLVHAHRPCQSSFAGRARLARREQPVPQAGDRAGDV
jgi:hypothetical protein